MATQFAFPASPSVGQIASLPDGNQAQWNGYAWVEVGGSGITTYFADTAPPNPKYGDRWIRPASATEVVWVPNANNAGVWLDLVDAGAPVYPLAVSLGGTGATTASAARVNLGLDTATGERIIPKDGTVALPGLAFASEPGLGWYRPSAGRVYMASNGVLAFSVATVAASTGLGAYPRTAGSSTLALNNQPSGAANANILSLSQNADGSAIIQTVAAGTATRGNLTLDAPNTFFIGGFGNQSGPCLFNQPGHTYLNMQGIFGSTTWSWAWDSANGLLGWSGGTGAQIIQFDGGGVAYKASGAGSWAAVSDARFKNVYEDYAPGLAEVLQIRPKWYAYKDTPDVRRVSPIAQDIQPVLPDTITTSFQKRGGIEHDDALVFDMTNITYALINAIKTIDARLKAAGL